MKRSLSIACIAAALVLTISFKTVRAQTELGRFKSDDNKVTLVPGEKLVYSVRWTKLPVGQAVMEVSEIAEVEGKKVYHLSTYTKANKLIRLLYNVDDKFDSYVEIEGFRPILFLKRLCEGRRRKNERIDFDWNRNVADYSRTKKGEVERRRTVEITDGVQDSLSALYYIRKWPLQVGEERQLTVATDRKCWPVDFVPLRKEPVSISGLGDFTAIVVQPKIEFEGLFVHGEKVIMWLDEETNILLKMEADIPIGSISMTLAEAVNMNEKEEEPEPVTVAPDPWVKTGTDDAE